MGAVLPLLALRAFTETTRLGSLKAAAEHMGVTPGAISQQIRQLEDRLGVTLLTRSRHGLQLTEAGASLYPGLSRGFGQIERALLDLEIQTNANTLTISTQPSFAASWLVPRLASFSAQHPGIEVRVEATARLVDLQRERIDIALRHGLGDYPGLESKALLAPVLLPVASPRCSPAGRRCTPLRIACTTRCCRMPSVPTGRCGCRLTVSRPTAAAAAGRAMTRTCCCCAAASGQGIALVQAQLAEDDLRSGRLVVAVDRPWPSRFAYYLVARKENLKRRRCGPSSTGSRRSLAPLTRPATLSCRPGICFDEKRDPTNTTELI
jgi:LysR family glycine cleavage system transcriptional activator